MNSIQIETAVREKWDAIVIGTGMGGGTAGYALAKAGLRVLFVEKGPSYLNPAHQPVPNFPESDPGWSDKEGPARHGLLRRGGRATEEIVDQTTPSPGTFVPHLGAGLGGSSSLYGAALERFFPEDFAVTRYFANAEDSSVVDWPISYPDLESFYEAAEHIYSVHGTPDPLRPRHQNPRLPNIEYSATAKKLAENLARNGLHPYRLPVGHRAHVHCTGCQGTLCLSGEKAGSGNACVKPAIDTGNAALLENCEAVELVADANRVKSVKINSGNNLHELSAETFLLGGGALYTPKLLFSSVSRHWPTGIGNHSDQLGRNLMRHYMDLHILLVSPLQKLKASSFIEKEIAFNDFYIHEGEKLGTVQSLGNFPELKAALFEMRQEIVAKSPAAGSAAFPFIAAGAKFGINHLFPRALGFATVMEDVPYRDNRVTLVGGADKRVAIQYRISDYEKARIKKFRRLVQGSFKGYTRWLHGQAENNQRLAHACGTCRMGGRAESAVVDPSGKVHGVDNLLVVDASVFPTGSGINPALTIAALALRAVDHRLAGMNRR